MLLLSLLSSKIQTIESSANLVLIMRGTVVLANYHANKQWQSFVFKLSLMAKKPRRDVI